MAFYIYELTKTIVEANTKLDARIKLNLTFKQAKSYVNKATEKDLRLYPLNHKQPALSLRTFSGWADGVDDKHRPF